jgi:hypothetical protein
LAATARDSIVHDRLDLPLTVRIPAPTGIAGGRVVGRLVADAGLLPNREYHGMGREG